MSFLITQIVDCLMQQDKGRLFETPDRFILAYPGVNGKKGSTAPTEFSVVHIKALYLIQHLWSNLSIF